MSSIQRIIRRAKELLCLSRECRERLIHIEEKIDALSRGSTWGHNANDKEWLEQITLPHPDQHYGCYTYSQHGDDLITVSIFDSIGINKPSYIDIGAHHPFNISNTALLYSRGSRGINIEPNPHLFEAFLKHRPEDINLNIGVNDKAGTLEFFMIDKWSGRNSFDKEAAENFVSSHPDFSITETMDIQVFTVAQIIEQHCNGVFPDFLTIDVEGLDEDIIRSIDFSQYRPKVICVEIVSAKAGDSAVAIKEILLDNGYFCLIKTGGNSIFVEEKFRNLVS